jgi:hypothetical protein
LTVQFGHLTQRLAGENAIVQIVLSLKEAIKLRALILPEQADADTTQDIGFIRNECKKPAARFSKQRLKVQSFLIPAPSRLPPLIPDESAVDIVRVVTGWRATDVADGQ